MGRPKLSIKSKRNNFTLTTDAQVIVDKQKNKSKFVSQAIVLKNNIDNGKEKIVCSS